MGKTVNVEEIEDGEEILPAELDAMQDEFTILAALGADASNVEWRINVYEIQKDGSKDKVCMRFTNINELESLTDRLLELGTADYRVLVYKGNRLFKNIVMPVKAPPKKIEQPRNNSDMTVVLAAIEKQNQTMMQFMERVLQKPEPQNVNPMEMMRSTLEMASSLAGLKQEPAPGISPSDMIALVKTGMEFAGNSGGGGKETNWMDLISDFLKSGGLEAFKNVIPQPAPQPMGHVPQPSPPQIPRQAPPSIDSMLIAQSVQELSSYAARAADPTEAFEWFFTHVPMSTIGTILQDGTLLDKLSQAFPTVQQYRGWFAGFIEAVRRDVTEQAQTIVNPGDTHGNTGGGGGDTRNLEGDATLIAPG